VGEGRKESADRLTATRQGFNNPFASMIKLTQLGGEPFVLNAEMIKYVESRPDTIITLTSGDRVIVTESLDEVMRRAVAYQQAKHLLPDPTR
jgi:flagellar protein FlbD